MKTQEIKKGIEMFELHSKKNNITLKSCAVNFNHFIEFTNISKKDFIMNFSKHPFVLVRGCVMLSIGHSNY